MMAKFEARVVILTGAAGGFGRAAARFFRDAGAKLVLSDLDAGSLEQLAGELDGDTEAIAGDICDPDLSERLVEAALSRFGGLDIAVNNAGIAHDMTPLPKTPLKVARQIIDVDLMGVFLRHARATAGA